MAEPKEFFERNYRQGLYGYTEKFKSYKNILIDFSPFNAWTHSFEGLGWRMEFRQKTTRSRMYLHFKNNQGFGFRIRIPAKFFSSINEIFYTLYDNGTMIYSSENAVLTMRKEIHYTPIKEKQYVYVKEQQTFEEALKFEHERIMNEIGDYRGIRKELPDNVINFSDYLKDPIEVTSYEENIQNLLTSLG